MPDEVIPTTQTTTESKATTVTSVGDAPIVEYEMAIRARIVGGLIAAFTVIVITWTFKPPQLPGDLAGAIVGGFVGWIGGLITTWGTSKK